MRGELLFVYGTLRRATNGKMARLLARHADYLTEATYQGRLYQVANYPGVVASSNPADRVTGDVYALRAPKTVLPTLDYYEGCGPGFPKPTEYVRLWQDIRLADGTAISAWVFLYNRPTAKLRRISSGDYLAKWEGRP